MLLLIIRGFRFLRIEQNRRELVDGRLYRKTHEYSGNKKGSPASVVDVFPRSESYPLPLPLTLRSSESNRLQNLIGIPELLLGFLD